VDRSTGGTAYGWAPRLAIGLALSFAAGPALAAGPAVDLIGTWYVLVHYKDEATNNPDFERWQDKVWVFEKKGSRLEWTEYPIVVFEDETGRFEGAGTNQHHRVLAFWEPGESQIENVREGLRVNKRGSRTKTLRGSPERGYQSVGGLRTASVSVIGYHESLSIEGLPERPVFTRDDMMGSARTEVMEGRTQYVTEEVLDGGKLLRGTYSRDGNQHGTFRMMRSGEASNVGTTLTQQERLRQHFISQMGGVLAGLSDEEALRLAVEAGQVPKEVRQQVRAEIREGVEAGLADEQGVTRAHIDSLTDQIEKLMLDEGKSAAEIQEMLVQGKIKP